MIVTSFLLLSCTYHKTSILALQVGSAVQDGSAAQDGSGVQDGNAGTCIT